MRRYEFRFFADVVIDAENISQARALAKKLRVIGSRIGSVRPRNNRDFVRYKVTVSGETVALLPTPGQEP